MSSPEPQLRETARTEEKKMVRKWLRRTVYIILAIVLFTSTPFILDGIGTLVSGGDWTEFANSWFGERGSAQVFVIGFAVIIVILGFILYFILNAFGGEEGGW
ncbi:MAG: hypothetical protein ACFFD3_05250 [Candidatus Thorarchaeota archaeon]